MIKGLLELPAHCLGEVALLKGLTGGKASQQVIQGYLAHKKKPPPRGPP